MNEIYPKYYGYCGEFISPFHIRRNTLPVTACPWTWEHKKGDFQIDNTITQQTRAD